MPENKDIVHAEPQKEFFIDMLTRDIGLMECILDLIDNSIHSLIRTHHFDVMGIITGEEKPTLTHKPTIDLNFSDSFFSIVDSCGGIKKEDARNGVFLFGKREKEKGYAGLGLYGVGMKRAFFKLGRKIDFISRTDEDLYQVNIDVDEWRKNEKDWTFPFAPEPEKTALKVPGVAIKISNLLPEVAKRLSLTTFRNELIKKIQSSYTLFLMIGLEITVNGKKVESRLPPFASKRITPARKNLMVDGVEILIIVGLTPKEMREPQGWYVFCNGRMIVEADKSGLTGWGEDRFPVFANKFNHFLGLVYFSSLELEKLPWTTTKSEVVKDSPVFRAALNEMRIQAKPILNLLSSFYPSTSEEEKIVQRELLFDTEAVTVDQLSKEESIFRAEPIIHKPTEVNIKYKKPLSEVEKIRKRLGKPRMSYIKVGEYTFEYYLERECD